MVVCKYLEMDLAYLIWTCH